jgi:hypothetical protein
MLVGIGGEPAVLKRLLPYFSFLCLLGYWPSLYSACGPRSQEPGVA